MKTLFSIIKLVLGISTILFFAYCIKSNNSGYNVDQDFDTIAAFNGEDESIIEDNANGGGGSQEEVETKVHSDEAMSYFKEIAYGTEFNGELSSPYKWKSDMKIYVDGQKPEYLMSELKRIVAELNDIINPIDIKFVSTKELSNFVIYFGDGKTFDQKYNLVYPKYLEDNWGYFELYGSTGVMYVDLYRANEIDEQKHLLREELTQSLGLVNDSWKYKNSIFYQGWTTTTEYSDIDRELIDILYNN
jgi:hypothetical protein